MSSILVSSQSYAGGPEIARRIAEKLGYRFWSERQLIDEVAKSRAIVPTDLRKALEHPPSLFGLSDVVRRTLVAHLQAVLAAHLLDDSLVFHVPYAHGLIPGVSHILRVRLVAGWASRVAMAEKIEEIPLKKAEKRVAHDDAARNSVSELLFGFTDDDERYDMVVDLDGRQEDAVIEEGVGAMQSHAYDAMTYSMQRLRDVELGFRVRSAVIDLEPSARVEADHGMVEIRCWAGPSRKAKLEAEVAKRVGGLSGVQGVEVRVFDDSLRRGWA